MLGYCRVTTTVEEKERSRSREGIRTHSWEKELRGPPRPRHSTPVGTRPHARPIMPRGPRSTPTPSGESRGASLSRTARWAGDAHADPCAEDEAPATGVPAGATGPTRWEARHAIIP